MVTIAKTLGREEASLDMVQAEVKRIDTLAERLINAALEWKRRLRGEKDNIQMNVLRAKLQEQNKHHNDLRAMRRIYFEDLREIRTRVSLTQAQLTKTIQQFNKYFERDRASQERHQARLVAAKNRLEKTRARLVTKGRTAGSAVVLRRIQQYYKKHKVAYLADVVSDLGLDLRDALQAITALEKRLVIRPTGYPFELGVGSESSGSLLRKFHPSDIRLPSQDRAVHAV